MSVTLSSAKEIPSPPTKNGAGNTLSISHGRDFFQIGGTLSPDAPSYVTRRADDLILTVLRHHDVALVLAPRQVGKSSLMVRAWDTLRREHHVHAVIVDFQLLGDEDGREPFFSSVAYKLCDELEIRSDWVSWWKANSLLSPPFRLQTLIEKIILPEIKDDIVLFFDEIDSILRLPFADEFFTTLRSLYNARATNPALNRLTYALIGTASPAQFIEDKDRTPFNIGIAIPIEDFDSGNVKAFAKVLGVNCTILIECIFYWTGGQPLLVQRFAKFLYELPEGERTPERLDEYVQRMYLKGKLDSDTHFHFIRNYLLVPFEHYDVSAIRATLLLYRKVLAGESVPEATNSQEEIRLRLAGVVTAREGILVSRNRLYEEIFGMQWIQENLPPDPFADTPLRRWLDNDRNPDYLLRGTALRKAEGSDSPEYKTADGREFLLNSSQAERDAEAKAREVAERAAQEEQYLRLIAEAGKLAAQSLYTTITAKKPYQRREGIRLALQALEIETKASLETINALRESLVELPYDNALDHTVTRAEFSHNGNKILTTNSNSVRLWDAETGIALAQLKIDSYLYSAILPPCENRILIASSNNTVSLWDYMTGELIWQKVNIWWSSAALSPDGSKLFTPNHEDKTVRIWDILTGNELAKFEANVWVTCSEFSPDSSKILIVGRDMNVCLWDIASGNEQIRFADPFVASDAMFSSDGSRVLTATDISYGSGHNMPGLWDATTGEEIARFNHYSKVTGAKFSPDGKKIITVNSDATAQLWDATTGDELMCFNQIGKWTSLTFSPDGSKLLSSSYERPIRLWDVVTGRKLARFNQDSRANSVAFSPDGSKLITLNRDDKAIHLWNIPDGSKLARLTLSSVATYAEFSPLGNRILTIGRDNRVHLWDISDILVNESLEHLVERAKKRFAQPLPPE